jgi:hypothetical protein
LQICAIGKLAEKLRFFARQNDKGSVYQIVENDIGNESVKKIKN